MLRFDWHGQKLELLPQKALYWHERKVLVITDPHFGKGATFRARGIPVPTGSTNSDLRRLSTILEFINPNILLILGDFFHAEESQSAETLESLYLWRMKHRRTPILLIPGNHDSNAGPPPEQLSIDIVDDPYALDPFDFSHMPRETERYLIAGHVHPAIKLRDPAGVALKAPCFQFGKKLALLPAFGSFTGTQVVTPEEGDRIFLVGPEEVVEVPSNIT